MYSVYDTCKKWGNEDDTTSVVAVVIGVLLLILPSFLSSNSNFKTFFTNLSIWVAIALVVLSFYFAYNYFF